MGRKSRAARRQKSNVAGSSSQPNQNAVNAGFHANHGRPNNIPHVNSNLVFSDTSDPMN
jgi:uncharacterized protein YjcR